MPSQLHESLLMLFRNQPALAELIRGALDVKVPHYSDAQVVASAFSDIQPAEYRADLVVELRDGACQYGIIVEVQLSIDERKRFVWPVYVANLRARLACPVCLLVITADDSVARWAAKTTEMGGLNRFAPYVLGPSGVPEVIDEAEARASPELAVLSAMAHGARPDIDRAVRVAATAQAAIAGLDDERARLYFDLIVNSLSEAARSALKAMEARTYEYQSDFARRYVAEGIEQGLTRGEAAGRAALINRLLKMRFGALDIEVENRIRAFSVAELDAVGERLLSATTLQQALGEE
jgi:hypothetical protein